jgi:hypothetical protein
VDPELRLQILILVAADAKVMLTGDRLCGAGNQTMLHACYTTALPVSKFGDTA